MRASSPAGTPEPHAIARLPVTMRPLPRLSSAGRWLQRPLCPGLILAQAVYAFHFRVELVHMVEAVFGTDHCTDCLMPLPA